MRKAAEAKQFFHELSIIHDAVPCGRFAILVEYTIHALQGRPCRAASLGVLKRKPLLGMTSNLVNISAQVALGIGNNDTECAVRANDSPHFLEEAFCIR